jgi:hypothetical protein
MTMTQLTQAQRDLLTLAAASPSGDVDAAAAPHATVRSLIKQGCVIAMPVADAPSQLLITEAGRAAIGQTNKAAQVRPREVQLFPAPRAPRGKVAALVELLQRPDGATINAMMQTTGWQAHSVRGAIAGAIKKRFGLVVISEKVDGERVYRIAAEVSE